MDAYVRSQEAAGRNKIAQAAEIMDRPTRLMRSRNTELLNRLHETWRMVEGAIGAVTPLGEAALPSLASDVLEPFSLVQSDPPQDEVMVDLRARASAWLKLVCPKAERCMAAAHDALIRGDEESIAHAIVSCRRALMAVADAVEPPGPGSRRDHSGRELRVGVEQYRNRLRLYFSRQIDSKSERKMSTCELDLIDHRLEALVRRLGRGVHGDCDYEEAARIYYATWSVIADVGRCSPSS